MDNHDLHLANQGALDLRHTNIGSWPRLTAMISHENGDTYASAALHCMHFLFNPPNYSETFEHPEVLIYVEWKAAWAMTLEILCKLLPLANTSPELVQFISNHDIHSDIQKNFSVDRVWEVDVHILAFLSRASACPNWRIISLIQRSPIVTYLQSSKLERVMRIMGEMGCGEQRSRLCS